MSLHTCEEIIAYLHTLSNPENVAGMAKFGINPANTLGISLPVLSNIAKKAGRDHALAQELWTSGIHEARILAALVDEPSKVTPEQMEAWAADFDSWDVCDQACANLFDRTPHAPGKALEWSERPAEFVKRLKGASSRFISRDLALPFSWQEGYGVYSISETDVPRAIEYVRAQKEHHRSRTHAVGWERMGGDDDGPDWSAENVRPRANCRQ